MGLTPQLAPTDFARLEAVESRDDQGAEPGRETLYAENMIYRHQLPQGVRYTKGTNPYAEKRSWQSLDVVLRSDASSSAALPHRKLRLARVFTALTVVSAIVGVAGIAASAREGLDLRNLNGTGGILLGGGLAAVALGITSGVLYSRARRDYDRAVDIYNDSLGVRLGLYDGKGKFIAPRGALVDKDGFIILDEPEAAPEADLDQREAGREPGPDATGPAESAPEEPADPPAEPGVPGDAASPAPVESAPSGPAPAPSASSGIGSVPPSLRMR